MQDIKNGDRIAVRAAFNRIQRFRVKEVKDVKAGTLYVTVRGTPKLNCALVEAKWFDSKPKKDSSYGDKKWIGARFAFSMRDDGALERYDNESDPFYDMHRKYIHVCNEHVGTWLYVHNTFSYNTRVMQVIAALRSLPHWEQYAVCEGMPFSEQTKADFEMRAGNPPSVWNSDLFFEDLIGLQFDFPA